ncbi:hypothetical protein PA7_34590 [Pseudonocardia asaccharolytica DSM 44247 = NBRC 16224]|uniref:Serine hydroxymethyltransferase-like domain-containing protein n=1 Tax=Pseudonocardia asaccharolytica DSM 44247 = NBRC 16224 TaxID=1123024 RepID=A0A511D4A7_9PSEU|nr:hypothetical protein PA7_34590 [Pseudonocardia asaccharolytica DSM 44247 = NBRC 16224]
MAALLEPGDTILGLDLAHGGRLTHGMRLNFSGRLYDVAAYHVRESDHLVNMDEVARLAREHRPKLIIAGRSAYPRHLDFAAFRRIADEVSAYALRARGERGERCRGAGSSPPPPTGPPGSSRPCCTTTTGSAPAPTMTA